MIHQKGFDSFTSTEYVEGGQEFRAALEADGWSVTHLPAHTIETSFPATAEALAEYDLVVISDVGANTFLLSRAVFGRSASEPNKREWKVYRDAVTHPRAGSVTPERDSARGQIRAAESG